MNTHPLARYGQSEAKSKRDALEFEATKFVELAKTDVSSALIGLFDGKLIWGKRDNGQEGKVER